MAKFFGSLLSWARPPSWSDLLLEEDSCKFMRAALPFLLSEDPLQHRAELWSRLLKLIELKGSSSVSFEEACGYACNEQDAHCIALDIPRICLHDGGHAQRVRRVLLAYASYSPTLGYVSNMGPLASLLLHVFGSDADAFFAMARLLNPVDGVFFAFTCSDTMPRAWNEYKYVVDALLRDADPILHDRWIAGNVLDFSPFAAFHNLPYQLRLRSFDTVIALGWDGFPLHRVALLIYCRAKLLSNDGHNFITVGTGQFPECEGDQFQRFFVILQGLLSKRHRIARHRRAFAETYEARNVQLPTSQRSVAKGAF